MRAEFSESTLEEWVLDLLPANLVPKRLAKHDLPRVRAYLKQPSYRPKRGRSTTDEIRNRLQQNQRALRLLRACVELSEPAEPARLSTSLERTPKSEEEAIALGYVYVTVVLETLAEHFCSSKRLDGFLKRHKGAISVYKPSANRKMVRAAELLTVLHHERKTVDAGADEILDTLDSARKRLGK